MKTAASPASKPYLFASRQKLNGGKQRLFMTWQFTCKATFLASSGTWKPSCSRYLVSMIIMPNSGAKSATYCTLGCEAEKKKIIMLTVLTFGFIKFRSSAVQRKYTSDSVFFSLINCIIWPKRPWSRSQIKARPFWLHLHMYMPGF